MLPGSSPRDRVRYSARGSTAAKLVDLMRMPYPAKCDESVDLMMRPLMKHRCRLTSWQHGLLATDRHMAYPIAPTLSCQASP